jgi:structural maintenance of chromosome 1
MREQRVGQATFLPLDTLQVKPINDKYRSFVKGARLAVDVLEFDSSVERAIHYSCGNALVCDNMDVAKHVVYDKRQEVKGQLKSLSIEIFHGLTKEKPLRWRGPSFIKVG